jgi:hypothetical protein
MQCFIFFLFLRGREHPQQPDGEGHALPADCLSSRGRPPAQRTPDRRQTHPCHRAQDQVCSSDGKTVRRKHPPRKFFRNFL